MDPVTAPAAEAENRPVVSTAAGKLAGLRDEKTGLCRFWGIPYAEPPLGALRFKPTVKKEPWEGVRDASRFGNAGPQVFDPTEGSYEEFMDAPPPEGKQEWVGAEDNLTLNVWTPELPGGKDFKKRPVMVWIHGGANWLESSRLATYHGDRLVERGDIVFVSLNYRLGVFGFLDVSVLGGEDYAGSHSNGLRDQKTALEWIKDNIEAFGGDAGNITIIGESAGSMNISWLLTAGHLDGIAKRVIMMSGVANLVGFSGDFKEGFTEAYGQEKARDFFSRIGVTSMGELQAMSTGEIMTRVVALSKTADMLVDLDSLFYPRVSDFAPLDPFRAARGPKGNRGIDVMMGYTGYEMGLWLFWDEELDKRPCGWAATRMLCMDEKTRKDAVRIYGECFADEPEGTHGMHLMGDSIFVIPTLWFADEMARHTANVWLYQFDKESDGRKRALHAADQTYLFRKMETPAGHSLLGDAKDAAEEAARQRLSDAMQDAILAFVRDGDPCAHDNKDLPEWPRYTTGERSVMSFNTQSRIIDDPAGPRREWWYENVYAPAFTGDEG
ncbi:MAG: carboxylesterase family protein [Alphaproteobacteria bacterium]|nr:carboxylesterase family protein [Alphaproteobacteria bacterium]